MSFLGEIKRRKVFQVVAVYAVVAWLLIQIVTAVEEPLSLPEWADTLVIVLLAIGFPITLIISWAFNLTSEGIVRDEGHASANIHGGRGMEYVLIGLLVVAIGWIGYRELGEPNELSNSVAILPCDNFSTDPEDGFFAASLHQEMLNQLYKIENLNVIARTSVMQYAGVARPIAEIARELRVESVMECSVAYGDGRIVISAQLVDGENGLPLWSDRYDREFKDVFGIQADIATNVANALAVEFSLEEQRAIEHAATISPEAYTLYLNALNIYATDRAAAIQLLDRALAVDPDFALAHELLAFSLVGALVNNLGAESIEEEARSQLIQTVREHASRALELDPMLGRAYVSLGSLDLFWWQWTEALASFQRGIDLVLANPNGGSPDVPVWLLSYLDRHDDAIALARRMLIENPDDWHAHWTLAVALAYGGQALEARRVQMDALDLFPSFPESHAWLAFIEITLGNNAEALSELRLAEQYMGQNGDLASLTQLAYAYSRIGQDDDVVRLNRTLEGREAEDDLGAGGQALVSLALGNRDDAFDWLTLGTSRAQEHELDPGFWNLMNVKMNFLADPLLDEPEFVALRNQLRGN